MKLRNKKYANNSLYGAGIFPFWLYVKYFGKPVYKLARKIKFNTYFSLICANILGNLIHVFFFVNGFNRFNVTFFAFYQFAIPGIMYLIHKAYQFKRKQKSFYKREIKIQLLIMKNNSNDKRTV